MIRKELKSDSLIVCLTPLQMLIAEKIISLHPDKQFDLLIITLSDNEKYRHYYQRLSKICQNSLYYLTSPGARGFLKFIRDLRLNKLHIEYQSIYLASIDSRLIQFMVSKNKDACIYTFDDGTANIISNSIYYLDNRPKLLKRLIWRALGVKYYMDDIKALSENHYTIYGGLPNIIKKTSSISLYNKKVEKNSGKSKIVKFYLGQPLEDISSHYTSEYVSSIINNLNLDFYYPHPREKEPLKTRFIKVIDSNLIFEDYLINYLNENPDTEVHVYSFISSCILNIAFFNRVKPIYIYDRFLNNNYYQLYEYARNNLNIKTLNID